MMSHSSRKLSAHVKKHIISNYDSIQIFKELKKVTAIVTEIKELQERNSETLAMLTEEKQLSKNDKNKKIQSTLSETPLLARSKNTSSTALNTSNKYKINAPPTNKYFNKPKGFDYKERTAALRKLKNKKNTE